jgi:hypothetical protein
MRRMLFNADVLFVSHHAWTGRYPVPTSAQDLILREAERVQHGAVPGFLKHGAGVVTQRGPET